MKYFYKCTLQNLSITVNAHTSCFQIEYIRQYRTVHPGVCKKIIEPELKQYCQEIGIKSVSESTIGRIINQDKQAELDAIRAKRVYEETERKAKLKEKEEELLKAKKMKECLEENEKHIKIKEEMKANKLMKEKEEYERLAKERQREIEEEKEKQRQKIKLLIKIPIKSRINATIESITVSKVRYLFKNNSFFY